MSETGVVTDPGNADAARAWDGDDGDFWAEHADRFDASLQRYHDRFMAAGELAPGERVLDIGCGTGQTTIDAGRAIAPGVAVGVDLSSRMLEVAQQRAVEQGIHNVRFRQADAQVHPFESEAFDAAISRTGAMFFADPVAAFTNVGQALRRGGRLDLLVWQPLTKNEWISGFSQALADGRPAPTPTPGVPGPFALAEPDRVRTVLASSGFVEITLEGLEEPIYFGADGDDAYGFVRTMGFSRFMLQRLDDDGRARALAALRASIEAHDGGDGVWYRSGAWIITVRRA